MADTVEFVVERTLYCPEGFAIDGFVNQGDVHVGDSLALTGVVSVIEIQAYEHKSDILYKGVTGRLIVTPPVPNQLCKHDKLRKI